MRNSLKQGDKALIVHGRLPHLTGRTCTLNERFPALSYDYAPSMGTFSAWDVTFDGPAVIDDSGRLRQGGKVPEIYLIPLPGDDARASEKDADTLSA
jgi:hypothetical protein